MEIQHDNYQVTYNDKTATITCVGTFRQQGSAEYAPISDLLAHAADAKSGMITLDVRELQFLNSSGINMLSKFVIQVRKQKGQVVIWGNSQHPWQQKSLPNFQRLLPELQLQLE